MPKYDSKKILIKLHENHITVKDLLINPAMYRWSSNTIKAMLSGQWAIPE